MYANNGKEIRGKNAFYRNTVKEKWITVIKGETFVIVYTCAVTFLLTIQHFLTFKKCL